MKIKSCTGNHLLVRLEVCCCDKQRDVMYVENRMGIAANGRKKTKSVIDFKLY